MTERRRFFPSKRRNIEPGQRVAMEVQIRPEGVAPAPPQGKPPVWAKFFDHTGAPMTDLVYDDINEWSEPQLFVAWCEDVYRVDWHVTWEPLIYGYVHDWQTNTYQFVALSFDPVVIPAHEKVLQPESPGLPDGVYPEPVRAHIAAQGGANYEVMPYQPAKVNIKYTHPIWGDEIERDIPSWLVVRAGNTCSVMTNAYGGKLTLTATSADDGSPLGTATLTRRVWRRF